MCLMEYIVLIHSRMYSMGLQCDYLPFYFFLVQLFTGNVLVDAVVRAVYAAVNAVIGKIQRSEKNDAVAVKRLLDFFR